MSTLHHLRTGRLARWIGAGGLGITLLAGATAPATAGGVTFHDIAADPASGIDYQRFPSATDAGAEAIRQGGPTDIVNVLLGPIKAKGAPGVVLFDYDRDGDLDVYVTNGPGHPNSLYSNQLRETGALGFSEVPGAAGAAATAQDSTGACFGDTDNDGDHDLLVLGRGEPKRFFENLGGLFVDVTGRPDSDIGAASFHSSSCALGDVNGDGLLDVFIANTFDWATKIPIILEPFALNQPNELFLNRGRNVFDDVSAAAGIRGPVNDITWSAAMFDYDGDGDVDLLTANDQGAIPAAVHGGLDRGFTRLFRNDGTGHFADVTAAAGLLLHGGYMGFAVADFNSDGHLDYLTSNIGDWLETFLGLPYSVGDQSTRWFLANGDGTFSDPGLPPHIAASGWCWGASAFDYDNDGDSDVLCYGGLDVGPVVDESNPGLLYENDGHANFFYNGAPLATAADHIRKNDHGLATGDLDQDGFEDVVSVSEENRPAALPVIPYGFAFGSPFDDIAGWTPLWMPTGNGSEWVWSGVHMDNGTLSIEVNSGGNGNGWVDFDLLGTRGLTAGAVMNRDGIGAVVRFTPDGGLTATQPILGGSSHSSQDSLTAHFGLGTAARGTVQVDRGAAGPSSLAAMEVVAGVRRVEHTVGAIAIAAVREPSRLAAVDGVLTGGDVPVIRVGIALVDVVPGHPLHAMVRATEHGAVAIGATELAGHLDVGRRAVRLHAGAAAGAARRPLDAPARAVRMLGASTVRAPIVARRERSAFAAILRPRARGEENGEQQGQENRRQGT